ncbi:unnamed protein product [Prorocentrum cordatum]|uniref:Uncharacterized protein n=1 Tax=Prorocentrum cordatum TaxID=2364126 RepID=A0ABN9QNP1_9DINO|nr:unnamed protein product [Polarella glacialis]
MAPDNETVQRIRSQNPQFNGSRFLVPQRGRPRVFVMGGVAEAPDGYKASEDSAASLQMSPDFTGIPFYPGNSTVSYYPATGTLKSPLRHVLVGGGLVETFAFGSEEPAEQQRGGVAVPVTAPAAPFSLARAVGISSAGLAGLLSQAGLLDLSAGTALSPQASVWPVTSDQFPTPQQALTYQLGDGGNLENTGLLAMLQRRAKRIAVMMNTAAPFDQDTDFCGAPHDFDPSGKVAGDLSDKFGFPGPQIKGAMFYSKNQVFARRELLPLLCELGGLLKAGKPLVARRRLQVLANDWWGIAGGDEVEGP